jgi:hypothetical protein
VRLRLINETRSGGDGAHGYVLIILHRAELTGALAVLLAGSCSCAAGVNTYNNVYRPGYGVLPLDLRMLEQDIEQH